MSHFSNLEWFVILASCAIFSVPAGMLVHFMWNIHRGKFPGTQQ